MKIQKKKKEENKNEINNEIKNRKSINQKIMNLYNEWKLGAAKEWEEYITKRCSLLVSEEVFFQSYENIITDLAPKKIICYNYEPFLYLGAGLFFGDTALDFENNKRNATIRAEEKTYLAYLQREDYINIISPMNKITRLKEIEFLYTKFLLLNINLEFLISISFILLYNSLI